SLASRQYDRQDFARLLGAGFRRPQRPSRSLAAVPASASPEVPFGPFRYCPYCATPLIEVLQGETRRPSCPACGYVQYRNPVVGVAVILLRDNRILLGRRA